MAICGLAFAWLVRRLLADHAPASSRPDVTRAALLRRTNRRKKELGDEKLPGAGGSCKRC